MYMRASLGDDLSQVNVYETKKKEERWNDGKTTVWRTTCRMI